MAAQFLFVSYLSSWPYACSSIINFTRLYFHNYKWDNIKSVSQTAGSSLFESCRVFFP